MSLGPFPNDPGLSVGVTVQLSQFRQSGSFDQTAAFEAAIAAVVAQITSVNPTNGVGAIDLGAGVWPVVPGQIQLPSGVILISSNVGIGIDGNKNNGSGATIIPSQDGAGALVSAAPGAIGCGIRGIQVYVPNAFVLCSGVDFTNCLRGGHVIFCTIRNSFNQGLILGALAPRMLFSFSEGFVSRDNGVTNPALATWTGGGLHLVAGTTDPIIIGNVISGGALHSGPNANIMRTPQGYHCAMTDLGSGTGQFLSNKFENGDTCYFEGGNAQNNIHTDEQIEWSAGHGLWTQGQYNDWSGTHYNNNSLSQNDGQFFHHFVDISGGHGVNNTFRGLRFNIDSGAAGIAPSVAVFDLSNGATFANKYSDCYAKPGSYISAPFVVCSTASGIMATCREAFDAFRRFTTMPPASGNFHTGETLLNPAAQLGYATEILVFGGGTEGTLAGVTGTTTGTFTSNIVTLNAGGGASVPVGSFLNVAGVTFSNATTAGNQVIGKNGDVLTMGGLASVAVSGAAVTFNGPALRASSTAKYLAQQAATPGLIAANTATAITTVALANVALQDILDVSYSQDLKGCILYAYVPSAGNVAFFFFNPTGAGVTPANGNVNLALRKGGFGF